MMPQKTNNQKHTLLLLLLVLLLLLHPLNDHFSKTASYQQGKTSLDINEARVLGDAVASAGPYANNPHLAADR